MVFLNGSNGKLLVEFRTTMVGKGIKETLTISVASTRVPTIFSLTRVFLSMI